LARHCRALPGEVRSALSVLPRGRHPFCLSNSLLMPSSRSLNLITRIVLFPIPPLGTGWLQFCFLKPRQPLPLVEIASNAEGPLCCDCLQLWRSCANLWSHIMQFSPGNCPLQLAVERPAWQDPTKGQRQPVLSSAAFQLCHVPHSCPHSSCPFFSPGLPIWTPASMPPPAPCLDFCPGSCFHPASSHLPGCPPVFISLLTREQGALSHPKPGI